MNTVLVVSYVVGLSFIYFGLSCFFQQYMKEEYKRYGLAKYRNLVGVLQLIGGCAVLLGYYVSPTLFTLANAGLCLLMLAGFGVRLKIRDGVIKSTPALVYVLLCGYLVFKGLGLLGLV